MLRRGGQLFAIMPGKWMPRLLPTVRDLKWWIIPWCKPVARLHREATNLRAEVRTWLLASQDRALVWFSVAMPALAGGLLAVRLG